MLKMAHSWNRSALWTLGFALGIMAGQSNAQVLDPAFAPFYQIVNEGPVPGLPTPYGGLTFSRDDFNVVLIGGRAISLTADIFQVRVSRDAGGHVSGFDCGPATFFADAPGATGGIDGGLAYGPDGVLFYSTYNDNRIGQIKPGSTAPDRLIDAGTLNIGASLGALQFVPAGFAGAGKLKLAAYNFGMWHSATLSPDGSGTFNLTADSPIGIQIGGGPEGILYVEAGNPSFANDSVLVCELLNGRVVAYDIDANGDPIVATRRVFISGLVGAEGAAQDPVTGDFLFSTFNVGDHVLRVTGFTTTVPCIGDINLDRSVGLTDLSILLANFGGAGAGDLNGDCTTGLSDLSILLANFGTNCP